MKTERVDMWVAGLKDKPGALADKLEQVAAAGANLQFVLARRAPDKPGSAVVFATPFKGAAARAAKKAGFHKSRSLFAVRLQGPDRKGRGAKITCALAAGGINLRGLSAVGIGKEFVAYVALDSAADAAKAAKILKAM